MRSSDAALLNLDVLTKKAAADAWGIAVNESKWFGRRRYLLVGDIALKTAPNGKAVVATVR